MTKSIGVGGLHDGAKARDQMEYGPDHTPRPEQHRCQAAQQCGDRTLSQTGWSRLITNRGRPHPDIHDLLRTTTIPVIHRAFDGIWHHHDVLPTTILRILHCWWNRRIVRHFSQGVVQPFHV
ncbi:hypothetical protein [Sphingomonas sp. 1185]|uniref:hypothetical protein n=1 Tax=Sphingomonas sp. 1185 TaxID=3156411 RepID=UPI0033934C2F